MSGEAHNSRFTAEQLAIIDLPVKARILAKAAAGTGKTHTLAGRLTRLVESEGLSAGDEVLVLSFSRAAVSELRRRISGIAGDAQYAGAATFDSFATRILVATDADTSRLSRMDYEARVRAAVEVLSAIEPDELKLVRHVLVDEIQDLVGPRADLVMALLERGDVGFTLFGDPAQAIYDHQDGRSPGAPLYSRIRQRFADSVVELSLTHDHRSTTPLAARIANAGARLRVQEPDQRSVSHEFRSILLGIPAVTLASARRTLIRGSEDSSVLLTRTNGEALLLSRALFHADIPHRYQRRSEEKAAPDWIAKLVAGVSELQVTQASLEDRLELVTAGTPTDADSLYGSLKRLSPGRSRSIDLRSVAARIRDQDFPEDINMVVPAAVVISTIHRAKGLEFNRVLLVEPQDVKIRDLGDENRVLYVALSRARREIFHLSRPDTTGLSLDPGTKRWVRRGFGRFKWQVREIEVTGQDTHASHPAGAWLLKTDPLTVQAYLGSEVRPGDPLTLQRLDETASEDDVANYAIFHCGRVVGVTSESFGQALGRAMGKRSGASWPRQIEGLHVELVDTVAGDASVGRSHGLGSSGLWLRVRVFGLGILGFGDSEEADSA